MDKDHVVHLSPAWRDRADFVIDADIAEDDSPRKWEQLWCKRIGANRYIVCCIPFFVYDLALGDEISARPVGAKEHVLDRVLGQSGRFVFRVWLGDADEPCLEEEVVEHLRKLGCELEWYSDHLLAVDADSEDCAQRTADYLHRLECKGKLRYETGKT